MGLFKLFRSKKDTGSIGKDTYSDIIKWSRLTHLDQLDHLTKISYNTPVLIFKHSTRCGASSMVLNSFRKKFNIDSEDVVKVYYLDLLAFREVSDEVAYLFQVKHQSPQLLLIKNGVAIVHASHYEIQSLNLEKYL